MSTRLWHQSMTELAGLGAYRSRLEKHALSIFGADVEVDLHGVAEGTYAGAAPSDVLGDGAVHEHIGRQAIANALIAQEQGYDAFVVGSFSEPALREIRAAVDIPVVSLNESTLLLACSLGARTAFVANAESVASLVRASVERHELSARVAAVRALDPPLTEPELLDHDPSSVLDAFSALSRELIADGADVIVPAEGVMCEVLWQAGLHELDGAPVLDSVGSTWRHALLLVSLWRSGVRRSCARRR